MKKTLERIFIHRYTYWTIFNFLRHYSLFEWFEIYIWKKHYPWLNFIIKLFISCILLFDLKIAFFLCNIRQKFHNIKKLMNIFIIFIHQKNFKNYLRSFLLFFLRFLPSLKNNSMEKKTMLVSTKLFVYLYLHCSPQTV